MFYNIYSAIHFAIPDNYTTFAEVKFNEYEKVYRFI